MEYFTILRYKLLSFNIQDDRSTRGLYARINGLPQDGGGGQPTGIRLRKVQSARGWGF